MEIRSITLLLGIGLSATTLFASEAHRRSIRERPPTPYAPASTFAPIAAEEEWESISLSSFSSISSLSALSEEETPEAEGSMIEPLSQHKITGIDYSSHSAAHESRIYVFLSEESKRASFRVFETYSTSDGAIQKRRVEVSDALYEVERDAAQEITKVSCRYGTLEEGTPIVLVMKKDPESQTWSASYTGGPFFLQSAGAFASIVSAIQPQ